MTNADLIKQMLGICLGNLPTILVCLVAISLILALGQRVVGAVPWALLGFTLALVMSVVGPSSGIWLQNYFVSHALSFEQNAWMFSVLAVINSTLHAAALIFLLIAVFAGRALKTVPPPLPPV